MRRNADDRNSPAYHDVAAIRLSGRLECRSLARTASFEDLPMEKEILFRILKLRLPSHCPPVETEFVESPPDPSDPIRGEIGRHLPVLQVLERQVQGVARQIEEERAGEDRCDTSYALFVGKQQGPQ